MCEKLDTLYEATQRFEAGGRLLISMSCGRGCRASIINGFNELRGCSSSSSDIRTKSPTIMHSNVFVQLLPPGACSQSDSPVT